MVFNHMYTLESFGKLEKRMLPGLHSSSTELESLEVGLMH